MKYTNTRNNFLLWELSLPGMVESSYLFGTIHLPDRSLFLRIEQIKDLIKECDLFMAEYNLDEGEDAISTSFYMESENGIKDFYSKRKYQKMILQFQKSFSINLDHLYNLKPMLIENLLATSLVDDPVTQPMDIQLWEYAKSLDLNLKGAESTESQLEIMRAFSLELQIANLKKISMNPGRFRRSIKKVKKYYLEEDLPNLYRSSISSLGKMKNMLVYDRNYKISDSIDKSCRENKLFCAVGAGHLYGYKGILRILKNKGFKVKPIKSPH